jgi:regulatory protein
MARRPDRPPKPLTAERLRKAALAYLERYAASTEQVRRVLQRRLQRAAEAGVAEVGAAEIEAELARLTRAGLLDDAAFAEMKTRSLGRRGKSSRGIGLALRRLGVAPDQGDAALAAADAEPAAELARAVAFARRRRLGPWRPAAERAARRQRDLAALGRQGFPLALAREVVEAEDAESLEERIKSG